MSIFMNLLSNRGFTHFLIPNFGPRYNFSFFFLLIFSTNTKTCDETIMLNVIENVLLESYLGVSYFGKKEHSSIDFFSEKVRNIRCI